MKINNKMNHNNKYSKIIHNYIKKKIIKKTKKYYLKFWVYALKQFILQIKLINHKLGLQYKFALAFNTHLQSLQKI